jgi:hypothetical protein
VKFLIMQFSPISCHFIPLRQQTKKTEHPRRSKR